MKNQKQGRHMFGPIDALLQYVTVQATGSDVN